MKEDLRGAYDRIEELEHELAVTQHELAMARCQIDRMVSNLVPLLCLDPGLQRGVTDDDQR